MKYRIFISSVQREFAKERRAIADHIRKDTLFGKFFDVFIFEETLAANVPAKYEAEAFLQLVRESPGFGTVFHATKLGKTRRTIKRYTASLSDHIEFRGGTKSGGNF